MIQPSPAACHRGHAAPRPAIVACIGPTPDRSLDALLREARGEAWLRVAADRAGHPPASWFRERFPGRLIYGTTPLGDPGRRVSPAEASAYDLVELDAGRDLDPEILRAIPPDRRMIVCHLPACDPGSHPAQFRRIAAIPARFYRMVVDGGDTRGALALLRLLFDARRDDLVAFAEGPDGLWSRILAARLGSPLLFAELGPGEGDAVSPTSPRRLIEDYGLYGAARIDRLFGIVGDPVRHSPSPGLHNAAYRALGLPALFLPFPAAVFADFWRDMVEGGPLDRLGTPLGGLTVASPHKEMPAAFSTSTTRPALLARSANLMYLRGGHWVADTTDPSGLLDGLARRGIVAAGRRAAVVGCGGSGRSIAATLAGAGARVALANRSRARGEEAALRLGLPLIPLSSFDPAGFDLIVNATPVGREPGEMPFAVDRLDPSAVVVDLVYAGARETSLVTATRARGARVIDGTEILLFQVRRQFHRMTGRVMPEALIAGRLGLRSSPARERDIEDDPMTPLRGACRI